MGKKRYRKPISQISGEIEERYGLQCQADDDQRLTCVPDPDIAPYSNMTSQQKINLVHNRLNELMPRRGSSLSFDQIANDEEIQQVDWGFVSRLIMHDVTNNVYDITDDASQVKVHGFGRLIQR